MVFGTQVLGVSNSISFWSSKKCANLVPTLSQHVSLLPLLSFGSILQLHLVCVWQKLKNQFILLFNLFLLLFMSSVIFFDTIHEPYYTISANFYLYLQYFQ